MKCTVNPKQLLEELRMLKEVYASNKNEFYYPTIELRVKKNFLNLQLSSLDGEVSLLHRIAIDENGSEGYLSVDLMEFFELISEFRRLEFITLTYCYPELIIYDPVGVDYAMMANQYEPMVFAQMEEGSASGQLQLPFLKEVVTDAITVSQRNALDEFKHNVSLEWSKEGVSFNAFNESQIIHSVHWVSEASIHETFHLTLNLSQLNNLKKWLMGFKKEAYLGIKMNRTQVILYTPNRFIHLKGVEKLNYLTFDLEGLLKSIIFSNWSVDLSVLNEQITQWVQQKKSATQLVLIDETGCFSETETGIGIGFRELKEAFKSAAISSEYSISISNDLVNYPMICIAKQTKGGVESRYLSIIPKVAGR